MIYLYLDESGDLGFDFVNKKPSKYFTVCIILIKNQSDKKIIDRAVKRTLRNKLNPTSKSKRYVEELKAISTNLQIKKYFYNQIKDVDFEIYSMSLNKIRVFQELVDNKPRVYNWIARLLLERVNLDQSKVRISFTIDKSKSVQGIKEFNSYIRSHLESEINPKVPLDIYHKDSKEIKCLQAVDLFAWGIRRKYENRDSSWLNNYKNKVKFDGVYLP
ncbi:DUF3800 domain-containing protein [bacterium]|nr:DUF3800 domain-containing protein [bacterium]